MSDAPLPAISFDRHGPALPDSPVVLSVPHAGRDYPSAMAASLQLPIEALVPLEDRFVDRLALATIGHETAFVQRAPRAWIDLNRGELERDPKLDEGADRRMIAADSAKLRSGLGLVPRQIAGAGDIWRHRLSDADVAGRIERDHRPYHAALAAALAAARARFGVAVLLDVHSMPPLGPQGDVARIVFGDRFGRAAAGTFVARAEAAIDAWGLRHALNTPYSGGYILDRHAAPDHGIHAIQIEFDRSLYLDTKLDMPGPGLAMTARLLRDVIDALVDEALATRPARGALAAE